MELYKGGFVVKIIKIFVIVFLSIVILAGAFLGVMTFLEYRPEDVTELPIENNQDQILSLNTELSIMIYNIGYAGLGEDEDFVMDGGKQGIPSSQDVVEDYFEGIKSTLLDYPSDFYLLQEVDLKARRSYHIDQVLGITSALGDDYSTQFAFNFKSPFVPFPVSLTEYIGYVESGLATYTTYRVESSTRYQLPGAFAWPLRVANLKRAIMVSILDIQDSDNDLYIINLHLSAYDASGTLREQEMAFLKEYLIELEELGHYVVVGGDFNQTFPEAEGLYPVQEGLWEAYAIEDSFLPSGYRFEIDTTTPSCRLLNQPYDPSSELTQYYIIDGYIVSNNITVLSYDGIRDAGAMTLDLGFGDADHHPVVMKFLLNEGD